MTPTEPPDTDLDAKVIGSLHLATALTRWAAILVNLPGGERVVHEAADTLVEHVARLGPDSTSVRVLRAAARFRDELVAIGRAEAELAGARRG